MCDTHKVVSFASNVVLQVIDGEALLLNLDNETVFSLNDTGARIAQLIAEARPVDTMVHILSAEYGRPWDDVRQGVTSLVDELRAKGLVVVDQTGGAA